MNAIRSNNVSLKYQRFTSSGYKVIGFTKIEFVAKSQFLFEILNVGVESNFLKQNYLWKRGVKLPYYYT